MVLEKKINLLKKSSIKKTIENRYKEFKNYNKKSNQELFKELSFCILTANYNAKRAIEIQEKIDKGFINYSFEKLSQKLKELGYRFPNKRAEYIVYNRKHINNLKDVLDQYKEHELREWFSKNIKGLSFKEASHFLRNIGYDDYAIIDFHIIDVLVDHGYLKEKPKTLNKDRYLEIEKILKNLGKKVKLTQSELDLYLWYLETNTVLK